MDFGVDQQEVIDGLVETELAAEDVLEDEEEDNEEENIVVQEEVVVVDNEEDFDDEEEEEEEDMECSNDHMMSADDIHSTVATEDNNSLNDGDNDESEGLEGEKVGEHEVYEWSKFTGLRVKTFTGEELSRLRRPFELGWKREVVIRGTVTSKGNKIGDVYYYAPDKTKLRSNIEMGLYLKRSGDGLQSENFTFARQPIYRPPDEIVRHAMNRGGGPHQVQPSQIIDSAPFTPVSLAAESSDHKPASTTSTDRSARNSTNSESEEQFSMSIAEGRAKRKRVAPTRFEDEDYSESPMKKGGRSKGGEGRREGGGAMPSGVSSGGGKPLSFGQKSQTLPKTQMSLQEKRRQLQQQLLQQVHEHNMKNKAINETQKGSEAMTSAATAGDESTPDVPTEQEAPIKVEDKPSSVSARKSIGGSIVALKPSKTESEDETTTKGQSVVQHMNDADADKSDADGGADPVTGAPCSMHCPGRRGMLPNLMCSRCFCLYHLDCVPGGVFLEEPRVFVCPNCLKPEDKNRESRVNGQSLQNGISSDGDVDCVSSLVPSVVPKAMQSLLVSSSQSIQLIQPLVKTRSTFAPILPKPPQLQHSQLYQQQMVNKMKRFASSPVQPLATFNKSAAMNVKLPAGTHLYRVATGPNGHSMIVKDKSIKPKVKNARKTIASATNGTDFQNGGLLYRPAPIAPIAPIKLTPQQIQRQLRDILHPAARGQHKRRGYREWMERHHTAVHALTASYRCLNHILAFLTVTDHVRLRQVSRLWHRLSSQPFLWRQIKLKGVPINDWQYLSRNIIEFNSTADVDFDGIKHWPQSASDVCDLWRNFATIVDYLKSVRHLRFGSIPTFVLEEIVNAAVTENPYNSFAHLEHLSVRNCFEEDSDVRQCSLTFLQDFQALKALKSLHVNCKNGFFGDQTSIELVRNVFKAMRLESLVVTSLKDFRSEQFVFLTALQTLRHLEIGSCGQWFQTETAATAEGEEGGQSQQQGGLRGAFKYLSQLTCLRSLRLVDITLDDCAQALPQSLECLTALEALTVDNLRVEASGVDVLDHLCSVLKCLSVRTFAITTADAHTNKCMFSLLKKLDTCSKLHWKVSAVVEDSGECFVPFQRHDDCAEDADGEGDGSADTSEEPTRDHSIKYMDLTFLNEVIQSELSHAIVEITPQ